MLTYPLRLETASKSALFAFLISVFVLLNTYPGVFGMDRRDNTTFGTATFFHLRIYNDSLSNVSQANGYGGEVFNDYSSEFYINSGTPFIRAYLVIQPGPRVSGNCG